MLGHTKKPHINKVLSLHVEHLDKPMSVDEFIAECFGDLPQWAITLRGLRNREGLTQKDLGEIIGVEQTNISKMERGKRQIGKNIAMRIAKAFGIDYRLFL